MSKELTTSEALNILYNHEDLQGGHDEYWKAYRFIEKQLQALEIIKGKKVNVSLLFNTKDYWDYNDHVCRAQIYLHSNSECLTQEEYDLLRKELL